MNLRSQPSIIIPRLSQEQVPRVPYISNSSRPLIAGHRGMAGILPENTKEAFLASLYEGSDFIELDVVMTKDLQVLVAHDTYLSRVSNVIDFPEFKDRKQKRILDDKEKDDWWICDFTVQELKLLGIKQTLHNERIQIFDFKFTFPTLEEVIQTVKDFNRSIKGARNPDKSLAGILLEIKNIDVNYYVTQLFQFHSKYVEQVISEVVHQVLVRNQINTVALAQETCPIVVMSFDADILRYFHQHSDLPRLYLVWKLGQIQSLDLVKQFADGMGIDLKLLWNKEKDEPSALVSKIRQKGIILYSWTIQDDNQRRMDWMNAKTSNELHWKLMNVLKLDGIITEYKLTLSRFPEKAINIVQMFREQDYEASVMKSKSSSSSTNTPKLQQSPHSRKSSF